MFRLEVPDLRAFDREQGRAAAKVASSELIGACDVAADRS
jgi:hypothetical protein